MTGGLGQILATENGLRTRHILAFAFSMALVTCVTPATMIARAGTPSALQMGGSTTIRIETPMPPPGWALMERALLTAQADACREFFDRYFDDRGYLECVERWGGDDGPDDAIENINDWPLLHALGGPDDILTLVNRAWEGHLRQYTQARTTDVPFARDGMYYKEFPVSFDWVHNGEGLSVFNLMGLSDPTNPALRRRAFRFAGFYLGDDPGAPNYDPKYRIIRSLFNGSRGPLLRKATALDWAGDPIEVENRFRPGHGERSYEEMLTHFRDYNDILGDHPQNLCATTLALNAFMLSQDDRYRSWILSYVDAWRDRALANGGIVPTNIGLDGKIGGASGGKWYGGVYGWGFSVKDPGTGRIIHRNTHHLGLNGFANAYLLTGNDQYLDVWRTQIQAVNSHAKVVEGRMLYPHMHGDEGWYDFTPSPYSHGAFELYYWSMRQDDRATLPAESTGWLAFLEGRDPGFPERALRSEFEFLRKKIEAMRADLSTPDTRLADDPMAYNPASMGALVPLMVGGLVPKHQGEPLHSRFRYFDADRKRSGLPEDVAALVEALGPDSAKLILVNINPLRKRRLVLQGGGYGEHQIDSVEVGGQSAPVDGPSCLVELEPGCGASISLKMKRYANPPSLAQPWN
jgi:hypothetical protein